MQNQNQTLEEELYNHQEKKEVVKWLLETKKYNPLRSATSSFEFIVFDLGFTNPKRIKLYEKM